MVTHFGGNSIAIAVLRSDGCFLEVAKTNHSTKLGGKKFEERLVKLLERKIKASG